MQTGPAPGRHCNQREAEITQSCSTQAKRVRQVASVAAQQLGTGYTDHEQELPGKRIEVPIAAVRPLRLDPTIVSPAAKLADGFKLSFFASTPIMHILEVSSRSRAECGPKSRYKA